MSSYMVRILGELKAREYAADSLAELSEKLRADWCKPGRWLEITDAPSVNADPFGTAHDASGNQWLIVGGNV